MEFQTIKDWLTHVNITITILIQQFNSSVIVLTIILLIFCFFIKYEATHLTPLPQAPASVPSLL